MNLCSFFSLLRLTAAADIHLFQQLTFVTPSARPHSTEDTVNTTAQPQ